MAKKSSINSDPANHTFKVGDIIRLKTISKRVCTVLMVSPDRGWPCVRNSDGIIIEYNPDNWELKPDPVERWAVENKNGYIQTFLTEEAARSWVSGSNEAYCRIFLMREVE